MAVKMNRREFLYAAAMGAASFALSACGPAATDVATEPTTAPTVAAAAATATPKPVVQPTLAPTGTPVPTLVAGTKYNEAPMLAAKVAAGELPTVDERLPVNPLVLSPVHGTGQYGGTLRSFGSEWGGQWAESQYGLSPLRWIDDGLGIAPGMCEEWESNADASEWTLYFRKGLKWSDGEPCNVDDVMYWWNDLVLNPDQVDAPPDFGSAAGVLAEFIKVDDYTLKIKYVAPSPLTEGRLAMWVNGIIGPRWIAPKHYLMQFHPTYNSTVKDFEEHDLKIKWQENPDCPTLTSWMCAENEPGLRRRSVRNPYYYAVDTEGNQLPYIDELAETVVVDKQAQILTLLNGEIDFAGHIHHSGQLADLSTLLDGAEAGNYHIELWDSGGGTGPCFFFNNDDSNDALRELHRTPKFKQAISHCLDREAVQKVMYLGYGELTTGTHSPNCREFTFSEEGQEMYRKCRDAYVTFDIEKAKALLDEIGMVDVNGDGFRERPDGEPYELRCDYGSDQTALTIQILELLSPAWGQAGLKVVLNPMAPGDFDTQWKAGQGGFRYPWGVADGPNHLLYPSWLVPNEPTRWSPLSGNRMIYVGTENTELDKSPWDRDPPRFASTERDLIGDAVWKLQEIYTAAIVEPDELKRHHMVWDMLNIHIDDGPFYIGTVADEPTIIIIGNDMMNVPAKSELALGGFTHPWIIPSPAITNPETYAFTNPDEH